MTFTWSQEYTVIDIYYIDIPLDMNNFQVGILLFHSFHPENSSYHNLGFFCLVVAAFQQDSGYPVFLDVITCTYLCFASYSQLLNLKHRYSAYFLPQRRLARDSNPTGVWTQPYLQSLCYSSSITVGMVTVMANTVLCLVLLRHFL